MSVDASRRGDRAIVPWLLGILAVAAALRLFRLGAQPLWLDEAFSAWMASQPLGDILEANFLSDIHPPLYYLLLHFWVGAAGTSESALRLPGALLGTAEVAGLFLLGRELHGARVGLLAAGLGALSHYGLLFHQEARMYPLLTAATTFYCYLFLRAVRRGGALVWAGSALVALAGLYADYRMGPVVVGSAAWFALWGRRREGALRGWLAAMATLAVLAIPLLRMLLHQASAAGQGQTVPLFFGPPTALGVLELVPRFLGAGAVGLGAGAIVALGGLGLLLLAGLAWPREEDAVVPPGAAWFVPTIFLVGLLMMVGWSAAVASIYSVRNLVFLLPLFQVLAARGLAGWHGRSRFLGVALAVVLALWNLAGVTRWYGDPTYRKQNMRDAAALVEANQQPGDRVVLVPDYQRFVFDRYYRGKAPVLHLQPRDLEKPEVVRWLGAGKRTWWVYAGDRFVDPEGSVRKWTEAHSRIEAAMELPNSGFHEVTGGSTQVFLAVPRD